MAPGPNAADPCPEPPESILDVGFGARIAKEVGRKHAHPEPAELSAQARTETSTSAAQAAAEGADAEGGIDLNSVKSLEDLEARLAEAEAAEDRQRKRDSKAALSPKVARREVVATFEKGHRIGELLAARAWQRGLFQAKFKAVVGDGSAWIQKIFELYFKPFGFVSVLDLVHAISYVYSAAVAGRSESEGGRVYRQWMTWIWRGEVSRVIDVLAERSSDLGDPQEGAGESEPHVVVAKASLTWW